LENNPSATFGVYLCKVLKPGHSGKQIRNTWKVLKCGAEEKWRRSVGSIAWEIRVKGERDYIHYKGRLTGLITFCVGTAV